MAKKPARASQPRASPLRSIAPRKRIESDANAARVAQQSEYEIGDRVSHPMFGDGTVTEIDADKLTIKFSNNVIKQIVDSYVKPSK